MLDRCQRVREAASAIAGRWPTPPRVGIILGSGLGGFAKQIDAAARIPYQDIPHFPRATALGHTGHLVCGDLAGTPIVAMEGRCHAYEGYSQAQITLPVRVMKELGIELLILSNASGGLNPLYAQGEVVIVTDHINLMLDGPLVGPHDDELGPRHADMSRPYDAELIDGALEIARREKFAAHRGVYVGVKGPNLETRAEYRMLRFLGADVVGMSTVPEAIVAAQLGLRTLALATVTNVCRPDALRPACGGYRRGRAIGRAKAAHDRPGHRARVCRGQPCSQREERAMRDATTLAAHERERLIVAALAARERAYAPYSGFIVGAALLAADGQIVTGANVENASYGLAICAERIALDTAVAGGRREFQALAVATAGGLAPCGACRQVLAEFCDDLLILLVDAGQPGGVRGARLAQLLPDCFRLES